MDLSNICTNCFRLKQGNSVCPYCKKTGAPQPREAYHLHPGMVLNTRYLIGRVLGFGGFGVIYMALDLKLGRVVALKEFFPTSLVCRVPGERNVSIYSGSKQAEFQKGIARFLEEARNMADFARDPHIVNVFDFFTENRTAYIVMEYLNGLSLDEYIRKNGGKLSVAETVSIASQVLEGLKVLHQKSIFHRDINPKNIFITAENKVKIIDFGTAKFYEETEQTRTNVVSDGYAPPEQYKTKSIEGAYTDIYAVGATMYRAITGKTPMPVLDRAAEKEKMPTPMNLVKDVPESIDKAVMKAMAIKSKLRFQTADEMLAAINDPSIKFDYPEREEKKRIIRRNITVISILSTVLIALVIVIFATRQKDDLFSAVKDDINKTEVIEVYIPYSDEDDKEKSEDTYSDLSEAFLEYSEERYGKEITLKTVFVSEDEYAQKVNSSDDVCLFRSDVSDKIDVRKENLSLLADSLDENMLFLEEYRQEYGTEYYSIPMAFEVYVMYTNKPEKFNMGGVASWEEFGSKNSEYRLLSISDEALEATYSSLKNENISAAEAEKIFSRAVKNNKTTDRETAVNAFISRTSPFYIGSTKDIGIIMDPDNETVVSGKQSNLFSCGDSWYGSFDYEWSVSADATDSKQAAAILFLRYCLSDEGQQILTIDSDCDDQLLSLNKNTFAEQMDYKAVLDGLLPENIESVQLYSKTSEERVFSDSLRKSPDRVGSVVSENY